MGKKWKCKKCGQLNEEFYAICTNMDCKAEKRKGIGYNTGE
jgi:hypothetical protein